MDACGVNVRFDDGPIRRFEANGPSDNSTMTIFIGNESGFVAQLRKAKTVHSNLMWLGSIGNDER
jgi:hypothetical protein